MQVGGARQARIVQLEPDVVALALGGVEDGAHHPRQGRHDGVAQIGRARTTRVEINPGVARVPSSVQ